MRLDWLEDYIALAKSGSFSLAAESRFVTHPAFGRRIKALEEWVGTQLIIRSQPIKLTSAGMIFLEVALQIVDSLKTVKLQLQNDPQNSMNSLRIATGRALASLFFPQWYKELVDDLGFFHAHISTSGAEGSIYKFLSKESDLLIAYKTPLTDLLINTEDYDSIVVGTEAIIPVSAVDSTGKAIYDLKLRKDKRIPWLSFSHELSLRSILIKHLQNEECFPYLKSVFETDTYDTILEILKKGIGIAWLPYSVVKKDLKNQTIKIIGAEDFQFQTDILLFKHKDMSHPFLERIWERNNSV